MKYKRPFLTRHAWVLGEIFLFLLSSSVFYAKDILAAEPLNVYVVNYPLKYFTERIGGDQVEVTFPAPAHIDPAYWTPNVPEISAYQKADLILLNGAGYAKWINKVSLPQSKIVNTSTSRGFKDRYITTKKVMTHSHGAEGEHAHESLAFTTWLDLEIAVGQAKAIKQAIARKRPAMKDVFDRNFESLKKDLLALDLKIQKIVFRKPSNPLIASHPVYDYLAERYKLNLVSVHWEPNQVPGVDQWRELKGILKRHPAKWMVWEGAPVQASVDRLKALGIDSLVFNPCGNVPEKGDFLTVMKRNTQNFRAAFQEN